MIEDTQKLDKMLENSIEASKIDDDHYLILREWRKPTPYVIHWWSESMGYFWGEYLDSSLEKAKERYFEKLQYVKT